MTSYILLELIGNLTTVFDNLNTHWPASGDQGI